MSTKNELDGIVTCLGWVIAFGVTFWVVVWLAMVGIDRLL